MSVNRTSPVPGVPRGAPSKPKTGITIRPAVKSDMAAIRGLIRRFPKQLAQQNLPHLNSFFVAYAGGAGDEKHLVGCCALQVYSKRLSEVRSLAVHPDFHDRGVASKLVECCTRRARQRGIKELFAVTSQTEFFQRLGFATFRREKIAMFLEVHPTFPQPRPQKSASGPV